MKKKKILALTLGLSLAVGSLTGAYASAQANERPAEIANAQVGHQKPINDKENNKQLLKLLKIDEKTFKQEQDSGKSLAEIGQAHNVSRQAIVDLIVKNMNQQVDKGLADKSITTEQASEMKTNAPQKAQKIVDGQQFDKMHNRRSPQELLTLLKIDEQTFKQEASSGKSLAEIGQAHNVSRQAIVDVVVKNMNEHIDNRLAQSITAEQATEMKTNAVEKAQKMVDTKPMDFDKMHRPQKDGHDGRNVQDINKKENIQQMLTLLKIDAQTFEQERSSGKSLVEIGQAHNVSRQTIVDLVVKDMNQHIDQGVADKRITTEQASEMKTNAVEKAQEIVDKKMMEQPTKSQE